MRILRVPTVVLPLAAGSLGLGGCATLERGMSDRLYVLSDPPGASVTTSFSSKCTTPCSLDVERRDHVTVTIAMAGYVPQSVEVTTRLTSAGVSGLMEDVATAGIGMIVDTATGATLEHTPNPVKVSLKPIGGGASAVPKTAPTG